MIKIINVPLYKCSVICLYGTTLEEWSEFFKEQYKEDNLTTQVDVAVQEEFDRNSPGFVLSTGYNDYVLYINDKDNVGLVAHEIFHAANYILYDRNYCADRLSEPIAYMVEYLTNQFYLGTEDSKNSL